MKKQLTNWSLKSVMSNCENTNLQQTNLSGRYQQSVFTFTHHDMVNGKINTFITPNMEVSRMNLDTKKDITVVKDDSIERHVCTFIYKGSISSKFDYVNASLEQNRQQHTFTYARAEASRHTIAAGNTSLLYINLKPCMLHDFVPDWEEYSSRLYKKNNNEKFYVSPPLEIQQNSRLQQILSAMDSDFFGGATRNLYVEAKAMELLALQLDDLLHHTKKSVSDTFDISKSDQEKLAAMYEYITANYLQPLSLSGLAKRFTLNEFKLKKGFRQLYKQSAFNYIHTLRMHKAKSLLQSNDMTVNEVSDLTGYSSIHNFSNAFYKMFKYRPSRVKAARVSVYA